MAAPICARLAIWLRAFTATPRRRRLVLVATLVPGVLVADVAVSVWRDPVMFGVGLLLIAAAVLAQARPPSRVAARAAPVPPRRSREPRP